MTRRYVGIGLVVAAFVLLGAAFLTWQNGSDDAERDQLAERYRAAIDGDRADDVDPSRTVPLVLAGLAAVTVLAGVVVLVSPSPGSGTGT